MPVTLHVLAELTRCEANLFKVLICRLVVEIENALESLNKGQGAGAVDGKLQRVEDLLLEIDEVLLVNDPLLNCRQQGNHSVERWRDRLLDLGGHKHSDGSKGV